MRRKQTYLGNNISCKTTCESEEVRRGGREEFEEAGRRGWKGLKQMIRNNSNGELRALR